MGVSGSGKSTIGQLLAERTGWQFIDADDYHSQANVEKMHSGRALTDEDRAPWLATLAGLLRAARNEQRSMILGCSALKREYRDMLTGGQRDDVLLVRLEGDRDLLRERMESRHHFMPAENLERQMETIEPPRDEEQPLVLDVREPPGVLVERVLQELTRRGGLSPAAPD